MNVICCVNKYLIARNRDEILNKVLKKKDRSTRSLIGLKIIFPHLN